MNLYCNCLPGMPPIGRTTLEQISVLKALNADVIIAQEQSGRQLDFYTSMLGPEVAFRQQRYFGDPDLDTNQGVAVFSNEPIARERSMSLGFLHADGVEHVAAFKGLGREVQAVVQAAEIETPEGNFWAVTAHMAWTEAAHKGLQPHQIKALEKLTVFLEELRATGLPIVLGADFNGLLKDAAPLLPDWMRCLITDAQITEIGTTIDSVDPERVTKMAGFGVFIDGVFASPEVRLLKPVKVVRGLSDHVGFLFEIEIG